MKTLGRRRADGITSKLMLALCLALLILSIYAIRGQKNFGDEWAEMHKQDEIRTAILAAKLESSQGCSLDKTRQ